MKMSQSMPKQYHLIRCLLILALLLFGMSSGFAQEATSEAPDLVSETPAPTLPPTATPTVELPATATPTVELPPTDAPAQIPPAPSEAAPVVSPTPETTPSPEVSAEAPVAELTQEATAPSQLPTDAPVEIRPALPAEPPLRLLVRELFDNGDLSAWTLGSGWSLLPAEAGLVLQATQPADLAVLRQGTFSNLAVQARFLLSSGRAQLSLRLSPAGAYTATLDPSGSVQLWRADALLHSVQLPAPLTDDWHTLRLSAIGDVLRVSLNDAELFVVQDPSPLPAGEVALSLGADSTDPLTPAVLQVDEFFLWVPEAEYSLYPTPTPAVVIPPQLPSPTPVSEASATPSAPDPITPAPTLEITEAPLVEIPDEPTIEVTPELLPDEPSPTLEVTAQPTLPEPLNPAKVLSAAEPPSEEQRATARSSDNDAFANRSALSTSYPGNTSSGETTLATIETGEPMPACSYNAANSVWFSFIPPSSGSYTFSSAGSSFDTVLVLYRGADLASLTPLACNDDASNRLLTSAFTLNLDAGTSYALQLTGFNGRFGTYSVQVLRNGLPNPSAPAPLAPANNAVTADLSPTLTWNVANHAVAYEVEIASLRTFTTLAASASLLPGTSFTPASDLPPGTYFWRVRARNSNGLPGPFSALRTFTIRTSPPVLTTPRDASLLSGLRPALRWNSWGAGALYTLELHDSDDFSGGPRYSFSATALSFTPPLTLGQGLWFWRVRAENPTLPTPSEFSAPFRFTLFLGTAPADGAFSANATPSFSWAAAPGATGYTLLIDDDPAFSSPLHTIPTGTLRSYRLSAAQALPPGTYFWRVLPDFSGTPGELHGDIYRALFIGTAPPAPVLLAPANRALFNRDSLDLSWNPVTPPSGVTLLGYEIELARNSAFTQGRLSETSTTTAFTTPSLADGTWHWRVRARFSPGLPGLFSAVRTFTVDTLPPAAPVLTPAGIATASLRPTLRWRAVPGAAQYELDLFHDNGGTPIFLYQSRLVTGSSFTPPASDLLAQGTYLWRLRARDAAGNLGPDSAVDTFRVFLGTAPAHGAFSPGSTPSFAWAAAPGATSYTLLIDDDPAFSSPLHSLGLGTRRSYRLSAAQALPPGTWYWRVLPDFAGTPGLLLSDVARPLHIGAAPAALTLLSPANNAFSNDITPDLTWNPVIPPAGVVLDGYALEIASNAAFTQGRIPGSSTTTTFTAPTLPDGRYFWRVAARYASGAQGPFSAARAFTVDTLPPTVPGLSQPAASSTLTNLRPAFRWSAPAGAVRYDLLIGTTNPPTILYANLTGTSFTPPAPLLPSSYFWQVRAYDQAGNVSDYSPAGVFKLVTVASAAPTLHRFTGPVQLSWSPISWTEPGGFYQLEVDDHSNFASPLYRSADFANALPSGTQQASEGSTPGFSALSDGTWYWRVRACTAAAACGTWSSRGTFVVERN